MAVLVQYHKLIQNVVHCLKKKFCHTFYIKLHAFASLTIMLVYLMQACLICMHKAASFICFTLSTYSYVTL